MMTISMNRQARLKTLFQKTFTPSVLEVLNESSMHAVPKDSETHFKAIIVSSKFKGMSRVARHRMVYQLIDTEQKNGLHAIALHLYTKEEWEKNDHHRSSPLCQHKTVSN